MHGFKKKIFNNVYRQSGPHVNSRIVSQTQLQRIQNYHVFSKKFFSIYILYSIFFKERKHLICY